MNPLKNNNLPIQMNNFANAEQFVNYMLQQNPNMRKALQDLQSVVHNTKDYALQKAKESGINPNLIMQLANKLGLH